MLARRIHFAALLVSFALSGSELVCVARDIPAGMLVISGGVFQPRFRSATDARQEIVKPFYLDATPVTNEDYLEFVRSNPRWRKAAVKRLFADGTYLKNWAGDVELGTNAPPRSPVVFVSWFAAKAFAQWKGKRLPTVSEWEFTAAASHTRSDGENDPAFRQALLRWYSTPTSAQLGPVGAQPANVWGVHDMHGLIWEWVADFNTAMVTGDARGDSGLDRQLFCGSASANAQDPSNYAAFMRYGFRSSLSASYCIHNLGFRCAMNFDEEQNNETMVLRLLSK